MSTTFERSLRTYSEFSSILDYGVYNPLPDDWLIGITDVVDSASAIRRGAYTDVNYAGVSVIAAIGNAWGSYDFPFSFGGDGSSFALPPEALAQAIEALQQVILFAKTHLALTLRGGLLRVREIRSQGHDVKIARYAASERAVYSMFSGGGLKWAEREIKSGRYLVEPTTIVRQPDLTGLSCDWLPFPSQHGVVLSLLIEPTAADNSLFMDLARRLLSIFDAVDRSAHPVPNAVPTPKNVAKHVDFADWTAVSAHSDFRKYDDLLRLTLDCSEGQAAAVETILRNASVHGEIRYGMHRQSHALMTCLVPSGDPKSHLHFLDGMDGGYARAAKMIESSRHDDAK